MWHSFCEAFYENIYSWKTTVLEYNYIKQDTDLFQIIQGVYERHNGASDFSRQFS